MVSVLPGRDDHAGHVAAADRDVPLLGALRAQQPASSRNARPRRHARPAEDASRASEFQHSHRLVRLVPRDSVQGLHAIFFPLRVPRHADHHEVRLRRGDIIGSGRSTKTSFPRLRDLV